jgi:hypothetical protein
MYDPTCGNIGQPVQPVEAPEPVPVTTPEPVTAPVEEPVPA